MMTAVSRRLFLAGSAAITAKVVVAAPSVAADFDVVIVGAGAAGIAAARRVAAARLKYVVLEANDRLGGRCFTDTSSFSLPYERGARWIHMPDLNPLAQLASKVGVSIQPAQQFRQLRIGTRSARESETEDFLANLIRCKHAISNAAQGSVDVSCAQALPKDLGEWRPTMEFVLGSLRCGDALSNISAKDFANSAYDDTVALCRQGLGVLLAKLAVGSVIQFFSPVSRIEWGDQVVKIETQGKMLTARAAIITASTGVLASEKIKFRPSLPPRYIEAIGKLKLGSYDHVTIEFDGNPFGLTNDDTVFEKTSNSRTATLLANLSGSQLCAVGIAGEMAADLSNEGESASLAFAIDWLTQLYGSNLKRLVKRAQTTQWKKEPWALGAFSVASPGGHWARRVLAEPLENHLWFAGEAVHETLWGTIGGAWEAGERAADAAIKRLVKK